MSDKSSKRRWRCSGSSLSHPTLKISAKRRTDLSLPGCTHTVSENISFFFCPSRFFLSFTANPQATTGWSTIQEGIPLDSEASSRCGYHSSIWFHGHSQLNCLRVLLATACALHRGEAREAHLCCPPVPRPSIHDDCLRLSLALLLPKRAGLYIQQPTWLRNTVIKCI